jgi:hypothetical protein
MRFIDDASTRLLHRHLSVVCTTDVSPQVYITQIDRQFESNLSPTWHIDCGVSQACGGQSTTRMKTWIAADGGREPFPRYGPAPSRICPASCGGPAILEALSAVDDPFATGR